MPRTIRVLPANTPAHLVQRAVDRQAIFNDWADFSRFLRLLSEAGSRYPVRLQGYCIMPNHWHLLATSDVGGGISRYMQWLTGTHAVRHRCVRGTLGFGHVYKGRFWGAPITDERHFLTVLRYIEANPKRAGLVKRAEEWRWSSAWERMWGTRGLLAPLPARLPENWSDLLNEPSPIIKPPDRRRRTRGAFA